MKDLYNDYTNEMESTGQLIVGYPRFTELWKVIFPYCNRRQRSTIPGKCKTCFEIDRQRRLTKDKIVLEMLKDAHEMHRTCFFQLERMAYKTRIKEVETVENQNNPTICSLIIDGMDQNGTKCPYLGSQAQFNNPLKQYFTGVKEHGQGLTLYRTIETVKKGADLTIHCILRTIENWKNRNNFCFPEKIYF
ncbi:MAG: hypothetical protein HKL80_03775 [Acidimicrobiales bacterium]|nr:hypothetical protein [Acidimicrobiales bacterium]